MAERITRSDVDRIAEAINETLPESRKFTVQGRNGYVGIDYNDDGVTMFTGSVRECYTYLQGMRRMQLILRTNKPETRVHVRPDWLYVS